MLALMAQGATNAAICKRMHLSTSAVEKHASSIFAKLGLADETQVHRRVAAVVTYLQQIGRS